MNRTNFQELISVSQDPWDFLTRYVQTQDPTRGVLAYPDYDYLHELVALMETQRYLLVPKSRQMMVTWTAVAYHVWRALFGGPGLYLFLSRNERCAEEILDRARFILDRLPKYMQAKRTVNSRAEIAFGNLGSRILSLPASPDGPRMYSPTGVFWDEMAFTPYDEHIWAALKPALDSGGRFMGVSSSGGAYNMFANLITSSSSPSGVPDPAGTYADRAGNKGPSLESQDSQIPAGSETPLGGSRSSLFYVHKLHYSAHPGKQSDEWKAMAALGMSEQRWQQEQEISFAAVGDLVYPEFDANLHILKEEIRANPACEIYRSIDFGYHHPFVLWFQKMTNGDLVVLDEWAGQDRTTEDMLEAIGGIDHAHGLVETDISWTSCDPAGAALQDSGISPVDILRRAGLKIRYRNSRIQPGVELVKIALADAAHRSRLLISPRCTNLIADFSKYRWAPGREEPLKDGLCDHSMDALRYFLINLQSPDEMPVFSRVAGMGR